MSKYEVGNIVTGNVTGIEKYGIFVSLDEYYSGLIHISEISDNFVRDVNDYVKYGDTIKAKIIEVDDDSHTFIANDILVHNSVYTTYGNFFKCMTEEYRDKYKTDRSKVDWILNFNKKLFCMNSISNETENLFKIAEEMIAKKIPSLKDFEGPVYIRASEAEEKLTLKASS